MQNIAGLIQNLFVGDEQSFHSKTLAIFRFQAENCAVYKEFLQYLDIQPDAVTSIESIPFLPITLFKSRTVLIDGSQTDFYFESSGTTQMERSKHFVPDLGLYETSFRNSFKLFYGDVKQYCIAALLPSYLERKNASLVYMCNDLITSSQQPGSGFFLDDFAQLAQLIRHNEANGIRTLLIGVSFALMDFADSSPMHLQHTTIMETGGMKGKRPELTRDALHAYLNKCFHTSTIHSEYGMTELLSQAYSNGNGIFQTHPWMKILIRDTEDPFTILGNNKTGCINVIDLANIYSCSFIATQDLGKLHENGSFEVLGRYDKSDVRGCNLMVE